MAKAKIISIVNYKGGVGKTTTTYHIGCSLAQHHGMRVLLVDIDPQTNLTFLCVNVGKWQELKKKIGTVASIYHRHLEKKALDTKRFIWRSCVGLGRNKIANLDLIACDIDLLGEDLGGGQITGTFPPLELLKRQASQYLRDRMFLLNALREVENDYDYILIDCPPNLYMMTQNALVASQSYVVTAIPDHLSTIGLTILKRKVENIGEMIDAAQIFGGDKKITVRVAQMGGVIFVRVRIGGSMLVNMHTSTMEDVSRLLGRESCFSIYTTELIGYGEASEGTLPVWDYPSSNAQRAAAKREYQRITDEFLRRF